VFIINISYSQSSIAESTDSIQSVKFPSLWDSNDTTLQQSLEQLIKQQGLWIQIQTKHLAIVLVNISDLTKPKVAELNGNKMLYAASLPKIAILLAAFVEIESGNLKASNDLYEHMTKMIRFSSNQSASHVLSLVGRTSFGNPSGSRVFSL